jgi:succinyl-diaminopimelate desuccinylase
VEESVKEAAFQVEGIEASWKITGDRPYIEKDENSGLLHALKGACKETGASSEVSFFPGYSDTAVIAGKLNNHNCMSYGPGELELAHKPDESVPVRDIERCEEVYWTLARNVVFSD